MTRGLSGECLNRVSIVLALDLVLCLSHVLIMA